MSPLAARVLNLLSLFGPGTAAGLVTATNTTPEAVDAAIKELEAAGQIACANESHPPQWKAVPTLRVTTIDSGAGSNSRPAVALDPVIIDADTLKTRAAPPPNLNFTRILDLLRTEGPRTTANMLSALSIEPIVLAASLVSLQAKGRVRCDGDLWHLMSDAPDSLSAAKLKAAAAAPPQVPAADMAALLRYLATHDSGHTTTREAILKAGLSAASRSICAKVSGQRP